MSSQDKPSASGSLVGKVAVVTGGGTGIGRATCLKFAQEGATVVVAGNVADEVTSVADEVTKLGQQSMTAVVDVTSSEQLDDLAERVQKQFGPAEILVTSAGVMGARSFITDTSDAEWLKTMDVNLNAGFYCIRAFLPAMLARDAGRIIMISSTSGKMPAAKNADYATSKHGVLGLMKSLAIELGILKKSGITANAICPGSVDTAMIDDIIRPMAERSGQDYDTFIDKHVASKNLQQRLLDAQEIGAMAAYLASENARGITGQAINVCAGTVLF